MAVVERAIGLASELVPVDAVRDAIAGDGGVVWLVIGRRSAGKSRLVNRLVGAEQEEGLGGVTSEVVACSDGGLTLLDSPGIEDDLAGADLIEEHLGAIDGLLWVVDGLQPLTRVERDAVERAAPVDLPLVAVVSRLDLVDPGEHDAILHRVFRLLAARSPVVVPGGRDADPAPLALLRKPVDPLRSPRKKAAIRSSLEGVAQALLHLSHASGPDPAGLATEAASRFEARLREAQEDVAARVRDHHILFRDEALQALHGHLLGAADDVRAFLRAELGEAPTWKPAPPDTLDLAGQAKDLFGGTRQVLDGLQTGADAWSVAAALAFEAVTTLPVSRMLLQRASALTAAREAVDAALRIL